MYHASAQGVDEGMINVHYHYCCCFGTALFSKTVIKRFVSVKCSSERQFQHTLRCSLPLFKWVELSGYLKARGQLHVVIVQELCESRGGRPGLSVLKSLLVSVDVKLY